MLRRRTYDADAIWDWVIQPVFLLALPIALWKLTGNPIPARLPSWLDLQMWWNAVQAYPAQAVDIVPRILVDVLWIGWAWYAAWLAFALLWTLLHLPAVIMPRILLRLTPRTTVQAITVGAIAAAPAVHAAPAPVHSTQPAAPLPANLDGRLHLTVTQPAHTPAHNHPLIIPAGIAAADDSTMIHRVEKNDTLWDLAERRYGDGEQWHRIYAANAGRLQPDGQRLTDPDLIYPGWKLAIPPVTTSPDAGNTAPTATTPPPAPDSTPHPSSLTPGPATDAHPANHPPAHGTSDPHRQAAPRAPRTVGWHIPGGGYIGITLLAATAASVALLRTRRRRHPDSPAAQIPDRVAQLAAVYGAASAADTCGHDPQEHPGQQPPPRNTPTRGAVILGTAADQRHEVDHDSASPAGLLCYTGPGAEDAARALIISTLSATTLADGLGTRAVLIDRHLAEELVGAGADKPMPGWLHLADTPHAAVTAFYTAARRHATHPSPGPAQPGTTQDVDTTLVLRADPHLYDAVIEACALVRAGSLAAVLLGAAAPADQIVTTITLDQDGTIQDVTGPHDAAIERMDVHTLPRELAGDLYRVLRAARTPYPDPPPGDRNEQPPGETATALAHSTPRISPEPDTDALDPRTRSGAAPTGGALSVIETPAPPQTDPRALTHTPLLLRLLGPLDILGPRGNATPSGEKLHMLLTLLALRPAGHSAQQLADAGWAEIDDEEQRRRAAYTTVSRARGPFHTAHGTDPSDPGKYIIKDHGAFRLDPDQITTDVALFDDLERQADHAADDTERRSLLTQAVALHRGSLAHGVGDEGRDWLADARLDLRERVVRLHLELARLSTDNDPDAAVTHLTTATNLAPDDEDTTARAIRHYRQLDRPDLVHATYQKLVATLADLGEQPSDAITRLADTTPHATHANPGPATAGVHRPRAISGH